MEQIYLLSLDINDRIIEYYGAAEPLVRCDGSHYSS